MWRSVARDTQRCTDVEANTPGATRGGPEGPGETPGDTHGCTQTLDTHAPIRRSLPISWAPPCATYGNNTTNNARFLLQETQNLVGKKQLPNGTSKKQKKGSVLCVPAWLDPWCPRPRVVVRGEEGRVRGQKTSQVLQPALSSAPCFFHLSEPTPMVAPSQTRFGGHKNLGCPPLLLSLLPLSGEPGTATAGSEAAGWEGGCRTIGSPSRV